jgi:protoporphyrinogen oxidase
MEHHSTVIIGAGLAGISTALHLGAVSNTPNTPNTSNTSHPNTPDAVILEREAAPGGLCVSREEKGYTFDLTGHWLHLRDKEMRRLCLEALGLDEVQRESRIWTHGRFCEYPFQANLKGLPEEVVEECLEGLMEAKLAPPAADRVDFGAHVLRHFGAGIARHFMIPYNTKLWGVPPGQIGSDWCQRFVPVPDWRTIVRGAFRSNPALGYNAAFSYPGHGGIGAFSGALAAVAGKVADLRYNHEVAQVDLGRRVLRCNGGSEFGFENLVSTMPLPVLVQRCVDAPAAVREAAAALRCTSLRYVDLGIKGPALAGQHWVYVPEEKWAIYRLGCYSNAIPGMAPAGCSSLYVEIRNDRRVGNAEVVAHTLEVLSEIGPRVTQNEVEVLRFGTIPHAYVIYDHAYGAARQVVLDWLASQGVQSIGRYGSWVYNSMEDALLEGRRAAQVVKESK